jgi:hypothetical protein
MEIKLKYGFFEPQRQSDTNIFETTEAGRGKLKAISWDGKNLCASVSKKGCVLQPKELNHEPDNYRVCNAENPQYIFLKLGQ